MLFSTPLSSRESSVTAYRKPSYNPSPHAGHPLPNVLQNHPAPGICRQDGYRGQSPLRRENTVRRLPFRKARPSPSHGISRRFRFRRRVRRFQRLPHAGRQEALFRILPERKLCFFHCQSFRLHMRPSIFSVSPSHFSLQLECHKKGAAAEHASPEMLKIMPCR